MQESQINSDNSEQITIHPTAIAVNESKSSNKLKNKSSSKQNIDQLRKEIENINITTASNRDKVPLIRLVSPDEIEQNENITIDVNNNEYSSQLNFNLKTRKLNNECVQIVALPMNQSALMDDIEELSIPFDLKAIKNLSNESYVEFPTKLENKNHIQNEESCTTQNDDVKTEVAILNYEYVLLGCEQHKGLENDKMRSKIHTEISAPEYVYYYTDTTTFINIFEKRKLNMQQVFYENKLLNAIVLLKTPPNSTDSEILLQMYGPGVPINSASVKCYIQFKLELLLNFKNSIIDLKNGKYLCLKAIQLGKKNPKHDFRNFIN